MNVNYKWKTRAFFSDDMMTSLNDFLNLQLLRGKENTLTVKHIAVAILIFLLIQLLFWALNRWLLRRYFQRKNVDVGRSYAITRLIKYAFFFAAIIIAIQSTGYKLTALLTALAALLVGVGIGLQQTFNDLISGIILLSEGSVKKGDWIEVGDMEGMVEKIGLRTSLIRTRRNVSVIVPNSQITVDKVINLSHNSKNVRYTVSVGVAYGTSPELVKELLLAVAKAHNQVLDKPQPSVRFIDFGDSSLNFNLLFWARSFISIEDIRSDLRFMINKTFLENRIEIPFPQRDMHIKSYPMDDTFRVKMNKEG